MPDKKFQTWAFLGLLLLVLVLVAAIFRPYLSVLAFGAILSLLFRPFYNKLLRRFGSPTPAALVTVVCAALILFIPLWLFGQLLFGELLSWYQQYKAGQLVLDAGSVIANLPPQLQSAGQSLVSDLSGLLGRLGGNALQFISAVLSNIASFFFTVFLLFFTVFYFLRDGRAIKQILIDLSPISTSKENALFVRLHSAINGVILGSFLVALIQGTLATLGFLIFGVPKPFLWGAFTVIAALVPTVGTALAIVPAVLLLLILGHPAAAVGLTVWGVLAVGLIDNFASPKLIGAKTKLHPLLVLFGVLGGIQLFGFIGFLLGPIILAVFAEIIQMYRQDFKDYLG